MTNPDDDCFEKAVSEKKFEKIELLFPLVSEGVKRQYMTGNGFNPLHSASSPEVIRYFISTGIDVNVKNLETDETPLLTVIKLNKSPNVVKELLKHGASTEARNKLTMNIPLNQASQNLNCPPETIQALIEKGADIHTANKYCDTPLHNACRCFRGDLRIIELLLKAGNPPANFRNLKGDTPLDVCVQNPCCNVEVVRKLLEFNAKVTVITIKNAVKMLHNDYLNIISELLKHAFLPNDCEWSSILEHLLMHVTNDQKLMDCGKLIIKFSFLQCDDHHPLLVHTLQKFKGPLAHFLHGSGIVMANERRLKYAQEVGSSLSIVCGNLISFSNDCFSQINHMKTEMLGNNTSIYELIVSKNRNVYLDGKILKILKESTYPNYSDIVLNKIKRSAILNKLIQQTIYTIAENSDVTRRIVLDSFSVCCIAKYLNELEIRNFADAFCYSSKDGYFWDRLVDIEAYLSKRHRIGRPVTKKKLVSPNGHSSYKFQKKSSPRI